MTSSPGRTESSPSTAAAITTLRTASAAAGIELPTVPGIPTKAGPTRTALWLSPRSWLIQCPLEEESALQKRINTAFPDKTVHAVRFSDALCWLELTGSAARQLLTEGGFVSLERDGLRVGRAKRTLIAQIPAVVFHESESTWLIGVERSRARYFAQWLTDTAAA